jgi:SAM-dependent methyltransferase
MHPSVMEFVKGVVEEYKLAWGPTLEVGSYDVNGSVRPLFRGAYIGLDMRPGPGVDVVGLADAMDWGDRQFQVVVCTEMLEHDARPWRSMLEMARVLNPGGYLILTARGYDERGCFPVHDHPSDHWRFSVSGITTLLEYADLDPVTVTPDPTDPGVFVLARKP